MFGIDFSNVLPLDTSVKQGPIPLHPVLKEDSELMPVLTVCHSVRNVRPVKLVLNLV